MLNENKHSLDADAVLACSGLSRKTLRGWLISQLARQIDTWLSAPATRRAPSDILIDAVLRPQLERIANTTDSPELDPAVRAIVRAMMALEDAATVGRPGATERTLLWLNRRLEPTKHWTFTDCADGAAV